MSFWSAMVAIVAILAFTAARVARYKAGLGDPGWDRWQHGQAQPGPSPREIELQREVQDLRDRIAVLERIATDANSASERRTRQIAEDIERLRDS